MKVFSQFLKNSKDMFHRTPAARVAAFASCGIAAVAAVMGDPSAMIAALAGAGAFYTASPRAPAAGRRPIRTQRLER